LKGFPRFSLLVIMSIIAIAWPLEPWTTVVPIALVFPIFVVDLGSLPAGVRGGRCVRGHIGYRLDDNDRNRPLWGSKYSDSGPCAWRARRHLGYRALRLPPCLPSGAGTKPRLRRTKPDCRRP
jgi:hypothetical protein